MKNYLSLMILPLFASADGFTAGMLPWAVKAEEVYAIVPELEKVVSELDAALEGMRAKGMDSGERVIARRRTGSLRHVNGLCVMKTRNMIGEWRLCGNTYSNTKRAGIQSRLSYLVSPLYGCICENGEILWLGSHNSARHYDSPTLEHHERLLKACLLTPRPFSGILWTWLRSLL
jgi:hypothetical protein